MSGSLSPFRNPRVQRTLIMAFLWLCMGAALLAIREVLLPFGVALLLAYVLHPAVSAIHARPVGGKRIPRWGATLILYGVMALGVWGMGRVFVPQISAEVASAARSGRQTLAEAEQSISAVPARLTTLLNNVGIPVVLTWSSDDGTVPPPPATVGAEGVEPWLVLDVREEIERAARELKAMALSAAGLVAKGAKGALGAVVGFIFKLFLVLMLTAFLLSDVARIRAFFLTLVPAERRQNFDTLLDRIDGGLSGVVRGQLTICLVNGVLTLLGLMLLKVKFAFLLGTTAAAFSLIPIFGSIVSSIPIVAVALTGGLHKAVLALAWIIGIHAVEANLLNPKIMGSAAKIHPVLVVLVLVAGEHFFGFTGALFAVPVTSVVLTLFKSLHARALRVQDEALAPDPTHLVDPTPSSNPQL